MQASGGLLQLSSPLPASLPALLVLYLATLSCAVVAVTFLRRHPAGRAILGEAKGAVDRSAGSQ